MKIFSIFKNPSAQNIATQELNEARVQILSHHSAAEYHDAMIAMYQSRIDRLETSINGISKSDLELIHP